MVLPGARTAGLARRAGIATFRKMNIGGFDVGDEWLRIPRGQMQE